MRDGPTSAPGCSTDTQLYRSEVSQFIEDCLEVVPTKQRMAFILREVEGLGTEEICKILEVTRTNLARLVSLSFVVRYWNGE